LWKKRKTNSLKKELEATLNFLRRIMTSTTTMKPRVIIISEEEEEEEDNV
jgi:hypothetical protein